MAKRVRVAFRRTSVTAVGNGFLASLLLALALCVTARAAHAQQLPTNSASPVTKSEQTAPSPPDSQSKQVQGYTLSPAQEAQAIAYARARHELYFLDVAYGLLVLTLLLQLRVAVKFREIAEHAGNNSFVQTLVFVPLLL